MVQQCRLAIANPVFSYVSLNGNGYAFGQDFEILGFGKTPTAMTAATGAAAHRPRPSSTGVVEISNTEYPLLGTGESHGKLRFLGAFDEVLRAPVDTHFPASNGFGADESSCFPELPKGSRRRWAR